MIRLLSFYVSLVLFSFTIILMLSYDYYNNVNIETFTLKWFDYYIYIGYDSISLIFIFLTTFFFPLIFLFIWNIKLINKNEYLIFILSLEFILIFLFLILDILFFYILFELILIPFFIIIGLSSKKIRRIHASYLLLFYTISGSLLMILIFLSLYSHLGTTNIQLLWLLNIDSINEKLLCLPFIISLSIKIPIFPFHIWLPEAHVESPTEGSVILAAIILKVGLYGFLRILLIMFSYSIIYFSSFIFLFNSFSIIYTSLITLRQIDIKKIIAYSSIGHMNICMFGLCTLNQISIVGSIILMLGHGFIASGLFFLVGILYDRYKTKIIFYFSGLVYTMPIFSIFFFFFIISNISFPGTSNFIGEFFILYVLINDFNIFLISIFVIGLFICSIYSILLYNKIIFGLPKYNFIVYLKDITKLEFNICIPIILMILLIGLFPNWLIDFIYFSISYYYIF